MTPPTARLRADAERNRALGAAATDAFTERGLEAPLDEIAKRAGVGKRDALPPLRHPARPPRRRLRRPQGRRRRPVRPRPRRPGAGYSGYVRHVCALQSSDRALADLATTSAPDLGDEHDALRNRAYEAVSALVARARRAGAVRRDISPEDLVLVLMANAGLAERMTGDAPVASAPPDRPPARQPPRRGRHQPSPATAQPSDHDRRRATPRAGLGCAP